MANQNFFRVLQSSGVYEEVYFNDRLGPLNNLVNDIVLDSDGKNRMVGLFKTIDGTSVGRLAKISPNGTFDTSFNTDIGIGFSGTSSYAINMGILSDDSMVISTNSTSYQTDTIKYLARLDSDGTLDTTFNTNLGTGPLQTTNQILVDSNDKIIVTFTSTTWNGNTRRYIVRLNSNGTEDTSFYTNLGTGFSAQPSAQGFIQSDGKILLGGPFQSFNSNTSRKFIVRLNSSGTEDTSFSTNLGNGFNSGVNVIEVQSDGKILVGGYFTSFDGNTRNRLVRLNSNGTEDTSCSTNLGTGFNGYINDVKILSSGKIIVGGNFSSVDGTSINCIALLNSNGSVDTTWISNFGSGVGSGEIRTLSVQSDDSVIIGGNFYNMNGITPGINFIYKANSDGTRA